MDTKVKKRWVKALRSGRYTQAQEKLFDGESSFCCLGVLCDIQGTGDWVKLDDSSTWIFQPDSKDDTPSDGGSLPMWFLDDVGLTINDEEKLIELNDSDHYTFSQIADYIEEHL